MRVCLAITFVVLCSCARVVPLNPAASAVSVSKDAPAGCKDVGEVFGKSNADEQDEPMIGARNDLKNRAHALGANHVVLETSNATTRSGNDEAGRRDPPGWSRARLPDG